MFTHFWAVAFQKNPPLLPPPPTPMKLIEQQNTFLGEVFCFQMLLMVIFNPSLECKGRTQWKTCIFSNILVCQEHTDWSGRTVSTQNLIWNWTPRIKRRMLVLWIPSAHIRYILHFRLGGIHFNSSLWRLKHKNACGREYLEVVKPPQGNIVKHSEILDLTHESKSTGNWKLRLP